MTKQPSHPFNVDVRRCRVQGEAFVWSITECGGEKRCSPHTYATFEEARFAMKEVLRGLIADKQATIAEAGDHRRFNPHERMASDEQDRSHATLAW